MLESKIEELQKKISDLRKRLPAHSVKPGMIEELEELEEELAGLGRKITETVRDKELKD